MDEPSDRPPLPNGPPPNFTWGNQPNQNWPFISPNFPPPPPPSWPPPPPFPPPSSFPPPPPPLPAADGSPFCVPPPPYPPPPVLPGSYNINAGFTSNTIPPPPAEAPNSSPSINVQAPLPASTDISTTDDVSDKNTKSDANTSLPDETDPQPPKNSSQTKELKTKDLPKKKATMKEKVSDSGKRKRESLSNSKKDCGRSMSSRGISCDKKRDRSHRQSHRSRSPDSPSRHRSFREKGNREKRHDYGSPRNHKDKHSRSPSFSRYDHDRKSRISAHRDHEQRSRYWSQEPSQSRRHSRSRSRARSLSRRREVNKSRDPGHFKAKSDLNGGKGSSKSSLKNQPSKDIPTNNSEKTSIVHKNEKNSRKKRDCKEDSKDTNSERSKKREIVRERRNNENKLNRSKSNSVHRDSKSKFDDKYHSSPRMRSRPRKKTRCSFDLEEEDLPALSTEPSKHLSCTEANEFYATPDESSNEVIATDALKELFEKFKVELVERADRVRALKPKYEPPVRKTKLRKHKPPEAHSSDDSSCSNYESSSDEEDTALEELERKRQHPDRLHPELWFNDPREMNDGPLCRCSAKARRSGIRHGIYVGETHLPACNPFSNNAKRLHHYKISVTPVTNFLTKSPTVIVHAGRKYIFEGFSLLSHCPIPKKLPPCKVIRFNYEYTVLAVSEPMPPNFTVEGLELFSRFLLNELLELCDIDWKGHEDTEGCPKYHFFPRFARVSDGDSKELLSLNVILEYLLSCNQLLVPTSMQSNDDRASDDLLQSTAERVKGMIVTSPGMKPSAIRVDQLDREHIDSNLDPGYPVIVHFGVRPPQLSYAGNPQYQKAWRDYVKYRHLLANKPKVSYADRHKLLEKETKLQEMRMENDLKRDVTVVISSKGFYKTGIMSDVVQHAMLLPILVCHLRFHDSLCNLEKTISYKFKDRFLLQLALTHPSYRENFGTNPDHARNSLTNCGLRQPQYGDRRIHYMNTRKRGINTLINIMSRFGMQQESASSIHHNERLEFLGDAVVEFLSSIHLFYLFPDLEEGGLATYRAAIVQNQHLAVLSKKLQLEKFMLYAHGSDLCHDLELRHAMANCFEALMGALFLDGGIEVADKVFSKTLFPEKELQEVWKNYPLHPLQEQEPDGDRQWIESVPLLQKLNKFEDQIGIEFTHIRLLARALTHRSLGYNNLTLGSNQRLEFLGDTVLQLVASEYLYKFFPQHHEGHLSLLRSSIVNNRTQAVVCKDLGMTDYAIYPYFKVELKPKDKADLLEAFLGALYVDKDLGYCRKFCEVCFFPRLQDFIMNQDWNDPKSKLQQCCLTLRSMDGGEPDIPTYKVIECKGPTNTRVYAVAVYFQGNRLAVGSGHSIQQAEMDAANNALMKSQDLFPQLKHQKRAIERSLKQKPSRKSRSFKESRSDRKNC